MGLGGVETMLIFSKEGMQSILDTMAGDIFYSPLHRGKGYIYAACIGIENCGY